MQETQRRRWRILVPVTVALLAAVTLGIIAVMGGFSSADVPSDTNEPSTARPSETMRPTPSADPEPAHPSPSLDIAAVIEMPFSPVWSPPDYGESYWQIVDPEYGYPATGGTDYVLAHACEEGNCKGDELRALNVGDTFTYLGELYVVDEKYAALRDDIQQQPIWEHVEDRVVLITCIIETTWAESDENDILVASPAT